MRSATTILLLLSLIAIRARSQEGEFPKNPSLVIFSGLVNYQGDLNPNSFTLGRSKFAFGVSIRQPLNRWFTARAGIQFGRLEAADRYNRDYLQPRNLSFQTNIKELFANLELNLLDINKSRVTPYIFGGVAIFHFNPWAYDDDGQKTYLHPLSTEGQGLAEFPGQKAYKLTQFSLPFGGGLKVAVSDQVHLALEFTQRKTFTDYLDDVSSFYVDQQKLLAAKGAKSVEMAYRGLSGPNSSASYPAHGEQRGTPSEMDWYYFTGLNIEIKFDAIASLLGGIGRNGYQQGCPRNVF